ncbi:DUF393 domain-containing protein [Chryseobacterium sp. C-71]|uniref:thiol-disulfide oxidoreductase DCC family protein n=1 Tax=Chryseobacterium sp. C-71 TaxID=2893882 RepID=UPI001E3C0F80|nr:DUF393 domain-containing protein [Chryseobacterium sp. C-71]UFH32311.1 DUF393 domain-containing protein [Chryseobacterium sp. C-71]
MPKNIIIYDGECGFCNKFILFIAKNDTKNFFIFTSNHSDSAKLIFTQGNISPQLAEETIFLKTESSLFTKGKAIREIFKKIPNYKFIYFLLLLVNRNLIDLGYTIFSKIRKKITPNYCEIPQQQILKKFI